MKKLILAVAFSLLVSTSFAQQVTTPAIVALACAYNSGAQTGTSGQFMYVQCDINGKVITSGGGSSTPCVTTALSLQYNNASAFGCVSGYTTNGTGTITGSGTGAGAVLNLTKTTSDTVAKSILDLHSSTQNTGRVWQYFIDSQSSVNPVSYCLDSGDCYSRLSTTISGSFSGATISGPGDTPYMLGLRGDINGANLVSRTTSYASTSLNARHIDFLSNSQGTPVFELSVLDQGRFGWGTGTSFGNADTFLNRGNAAASLQQGLDAFAPIAQHFTTNNVTGPITVTTTAATAAGNAVLTFNTIIPQNVAVGMGIVDNTTGGSIPGGTTILSIAVGRGSLTMSANAAGAGVGSGDSITFNSTNIAGADRYIDGSQGTGTGVGGKIHLTVAPVGSIGSSQNALVDALIIDPTAASTSVAPVTIGLGGLTTRQLTFTPNSGTDAAFGSANGGSGLLYFAGTSKIFTMDGNGIEFAQNGLMAWSNNASVPNTTRQLTLSSSGGTLQIGTTTNNTSGSISLTSATVSGSILNTGITNVATTSAVCVNTGTGLFSYDGTLGTCTVSDERLKNMGQRIPNALMRLLQINGVYYTWKDQALGVGRQIGVGAQTVERAFPELVQTDSIGHKSADYQRLTAPIIEAIRELKADNDNLRLDIKTLKAARR